MLLNFGRLDDIENNESIQRMALRLQELSKAHKTVCFENFTEAMIVNWGYFIYKKIWNAFGIDKILNHIRDSGKRKFNLNDGCFLMAVQHLLELKSKLSNHAGQDRYVKIPSVELHYLYRALDILCEQKEVLEEAMYRKNRSLFNMQVYVVFYDVTTFFFESVKADTLKDFGFSKDGRFNEVLVVMGMLID